jgi:hypothetical protein
MASPAYADSVSVSTQAAFTNPTNFNAVPERDYYDFKGLKEKITFTIAGKTCNLQGSGSVVKPEGGNYQIAVSPTGTLSGSGNCTTDIDSPCK